MAESTRKATNRAKKRPKAPKTEPFWREVDRRESADRGTRVLGMSFTDYAEVRYMGGDGINDPWIKNAYNVDIPRNYVPRMGQEPVNVSVNPSGQILVTPYTAADYARVGTPGTDTEMEIRNGALRPARETDRIIWPKYYQNPYQYQDYVYLQDIYANSIAGRVFDTLSYFVFAHGVRPKLRVRHEAEWKSDEEKRRALDEHKWMLDELEQIDRIISHPPQDSAYGGEGPQDGSIGPIGTADSPDTPVYETSLQQKWEATFIRAMMFGRCCMVPRIDEQDNEMTIYSFRGGKKTEVTYRNIPKLQLTIHPRDMGFNYVDYRTHRLLGVQLNNANWIIRPDEMIFWEHRPDNPVYGSKYYGMSAAQSMMGAARTLRRIIEVDFPLIAKSRWSGMYWLVFKRKGEVINTADDELRKILANVALDGINATLEDDPQADFALHKIDLDPKIGELLETVSRMIQYCMSQIGLPQGLLHGEQDLNRDTLGKKIATWIKGPVTKHRDWFLEPLSSQHYMKIARTLAKQQPDTWGDALEQFEVYADVEEFRLEDLATQIQTLMALENAVGPIRDEAKAQFLDMDDLPEMVDPDKGPEDVPPMPGRQGFNVQDGQGRQYGVTSQ